MKRFCLSVVLFATALAQAESPVIDPASVSVTQDPDSRAVTVTYTLTGANAIVTVDFQTNVVGTADWTSIGGEHYRRISGEVNKVVKKLNMPLSIVWHPAREWPGHEVSASGFRAVVKAWDLSAPPDYMVVDLAGTKPVSRRFYPSAESMPEDIAASDYYRTGALVMRRIPAKDVIWRMGSPSTESGRASGNGEATHYVKLKKDYYLAVFETTQYQVMHAVEDWSFGQGSTRDLPAYSICYDEIRGTTYSWPGDEHKVGTGSLAEKFRTLTGIPSLDLPTEAQWEFACRAGTQTVRYFDGSGDAIGDHAWYKDNAKSSIHRVGSRKPNPWGLYDMHGNLLEWCLDWRADFDSAGGVVAEDPQGASSGTKRVKRGGCYTQSDGATFRSSYRDSDRPDFDTSNTQGFRFCCEADVTTFDPAE